MISGGAEGPGFGCGIGLGPGPGPGEGTGSPITCCEFTVPEGVSGVPGLKLPGLLVISGLSFGPVSGDGKDDSESCMGQK